MGRHRRRRGRGRRRCGGREAHIRRHWGAISAMMSRRRLSVGSGLVRQRVMDPVWRRSRRRWLLLNDGMVLVCCVVLRRLSVVLRMLVLLVVGRVVLWLLEDGRVLAGHRSVSHILVVIVSIIVSVVGPWRVWRLGRRWRRVTAWFIR